MIEPNARHHGHLRINDVECIQAPSQTDFEHGHVHRGVSKGHQRRQGGKLEVGQRNVLPRRVDRLEGGDQLGVFAGAPVDPNPLVEDVQVGGQRGPHRPTRAEQHGLGESRRGTLPVCPGDDNRDGRGFEDAQTGGDGAHPVEAQLDLLGVLLLDVPKPLRQRRGCPGGPFRHPGHAGSRPAGR